MRVGVLTGGGDCPGLNAVIRAIVRKGVPEYGYSFVGFRDGWKGPLEVWQKTGANYAMHAPLAKASRPVGEWNQTRIVVNGSRVEHWLNGVKTADYQLWSPEWLALKATGKWKDYPAYGTAKQGKFGLQNHGNMSWFRNMKVRPL